MPSRVKSVVLTVEVSTSVNIPSWINLEPDEEGNHWWIRYNTLYYKEDGEVKEYDLDLPNQWDGDYKRPEAEVDEEEDYEEEIEDYEEALEAWNAYQRGDSKLSDGMIRMLEEKVEMYLELQAEIARGK